MKTSIKKFVTELIKDDMSETIPNAKMCVAKHKGFTLSLMLNVAFAISVLATMPSLNIQLFSVIFLMILIYEWLIYYYTKRYGFLKTIEHVILIYSVFSALFFVIIYFWGDQIALPRCAVWQSRLQQVIANF